MDAIWDREALCRAIAAGRRFEYRFFWGHRARKDGALADSCFSQWWPCQFTVGGQRYGSAEQFMMAGKARLFGDDEARAAILASDDPGRAKALGRGVRGFDEAAWTGARFALVVEGNLAKFGQDDRLRHYLASTREQVLVEASPLDAIWGIGAAATDESAAEPTRWRGLNLLGFALMRVRAILRGDEPAPESSTS